MRLILSLPQKPVRPTGIIILIVLFGIGISYRIFGQVFFLTSLDYGVMGMHDWLILPSLFLDGFIIFGLYSAKRWARKILLILGWIGLIMGIITIFFIPIAIVFGILVWYLRKPHVKEYFGINK